MVTDTESAQSAEPKAKIFISYSRSDIAFAERLVAALEMRGLEPLIDRTEIYAFEDWWKRIEALIGRADTVVFVLSPDAVASDVVTKEIAYATSLNKRFAPIVCRRVDDGSTPEALRRLNFIFFDDLTRFETSADALVEALQTNIDWIRQHTEYGEAERRWSVAGRPSGILLHSPALEVAEHWIVSRPRGAPEPTREIQAFVAASRQGARVTQRIRRITLASTFALLGGVILGLIGWINQAYIEDQMNWYWTMRPYRVANVDPYVLKAEAERALKPGQVFHECAKNCPEMIVLPAGSFSMGSPATEKGRFDNEGPQHRVTIARPFAVSKFDATYADWDACVSVGGCPQVADDGNGRGTRPVVNVTWDDAQQYVAWFAKMTEQPYRLLTEAEWEYAARAGSTTAYFWGDEVGENNANCPGCGIKSSLERTLPVGSFKPNAFGLYDMAGNAAQWLQDCPQKYGVGPADGSAWTVADCRYHAVRGGAWVFGPRGIRSASRGGLAPGDRSAWLGFRLGRTLITP